MKKLITFLFLVLTFSILTHSKLSLYYAFTGLNLWFEKMIPTLLPFMILSGIMIRLNLSEGFTTFVFPFIGPIYRVSKNACYAMIIGFLCGFPMGAKTIRDLYERQMLTKQEAEFLLAFCNNIGPVYFCGFVLPLLGRKLIAPYLLGMYGLPLLYGLFLRFTFFRHEKANTLHCNISRERTTCNMSQLLTALEESIASAVQSMLTLGGYMILFNLFNLVPHILLGDSPRILAPIFEITGGLLLLRDTSPLYSLLLMPFGGLSCIAQTYSCLKGTDLSISDYTFHKLILTGITAMYYFCWSIMDASSFMC